MVQPYRSLESAHAGETFAIRGFRSKEVVRLCEQLGIHEGDAVHCRAKTRACLILRTPAGRVISLDQDLARHVQIDEKRFAESRGESEGEIQERGGRARP